MSLQPVTLHHQMRACLTDVAAAVGGTLTADDAPSYQLRWPMPDGSFRALHFIFTSDDLSSDVKILGVGWRDNESISRRFSVSAELMRLSLYGDQPPVFSNAHGWCSNLVIALYENVSAWSPLGFTDVSELPPRPAGVEKVGNEWCVAGHVPA